MFCRDYEEQAINLKDLIEHFIQTGDYHQATHDIIESIRLEQSLTETTILKIRMGE